MIPIKLVQYIFRWKAGWASCSHFWRRCTTSSRRCPRPFPAQTIAARMGGVSI